MSAALFIRSGTGWPVPKHANLNQRHLQQFVKQLLASRPLLRGWPRAARNGASCSRPSVSHLVVWIRIQLTPVTTPPRPMDMPSQQVSHGRGLHATHHISSQAMQRTVSKSATGPIGCVTTRPSGWIPRVCPTSPFLLSTYTTIEDFQTFKLLTLAAHPPQHTFRGTYLMLIVLDST